ncbi:hypothetical protein ACJMK2_040681 [Sinanodonta woodiana]|uniref:TauD/TfdA-like domain-containing protein n=1 Tax=Sinanodonta woodiana TaxID=1069815 RepID=A0ABD3W5F9_SINWO
MDLSLLKLGAEIRGIKLADTVPDKTINDIKDLVHKHKILIFRDQGIITGERHVEISRWFGELESTFYRHSRSPHPDVFRVSNDEKEGCTNVGRTGWHIDGSFLEAPFSFSIYHIVSVPKMGNTDFVPFDQLIGSLAQEMRSEWDRLWIVSDRRSGLTHPLIYQHPITGQETLCFHLGMTEMFVWDFDTDHARMTDWPETMEILKNIHQEIIKNKRELIYSHKWEEGDFIISDNLALGHEATPETQWHRSDVGLRVLHRTTIRGTNVPTKHKDRTR